MTTVVYRDGKMVGDSAVFDRGCYVGAVNKVFRNDGGWLLGGAGRLGEMAAYRDWFMAGMIGAAPEINEDDSEMLIVSPEGKAYWYGTSGRHVEIAGNFHAIGSGFRIAMGALHAGANAWRAVEICAELDEMTRGPLCEVSLNG